MKRLFSTLSLLLLLVTALPAQTSLTEYRPGVTTEGAVYFLPKTAVRLSLLIEKTSYKPGEYCQYAQRYLRLADIEQEPRTSYRIISIAQTPFAVADTSKAYAVKFDARTAAANVSLSADGRLLAINAQASEPEQPKAFKAAPKPAPLDPRKYMSEEILAAGSTAKMAELTSREIYDLRENRNLLIKGQADFMPNDGNQMKLMLAQLETQEQALLQLFQGTTVRDTLEETIVIRPSRPIERQVAFRFSQKRGLVDADDLSGIPYYIIVEDLTALPAPAEEAKTAPKKKKTESGVYVNVPGKMRLTILQADNKLSSSEYPAGQFGRVELLSGELFNKRYTTHLWLHPLSGAVERLEAEQPKK